MYIKSANRHLTPLSKTILLTQIIVMNHILEKVSKKFEISNDKGCERKTSRK